MHKIHYTYIYMDQNIINYYDLIASWVLQAALNIFLFLGFILSFFLSFFIILYNIWFPTPSTAFHLETPIDFYNVHISSDSCATTFLNEIS